MTVPIRIDDAVARDADGFLLDAEEWTEELAGELARESGIEPFTSRHRQVINSMRAAYVDHGALPWVHMVAAVSGVTVAELFQLFPQAPSRLVTKIAGIPRNRACI